MGWMRLVRSIKLSGSFAKEPYEKDCNLPKRPIIWRSLLIVATPYDTHEWGVSHTWMSHVTHAREGSMSHKWMSHVTRMNESCHTNKWVMSHIWRSHVTYMNESCPIYEWVMSHIWMSHVPCTNESCHTWICLTSVTLAKAVSWKYSETSEASDLHAIKSESAGRNAGNQHWWLDSRKKVGGWILEKKKMLDACHLHAHQMYTRLQKSPVILQNSPMFLRCFLDFRRRLACTYTCVYAKC